MSSSRSAVKRLLGLRPGPDLLKRWANARSRSTPLAEFERVLLRHSRASPDEALRAVDHVLAGTNGGTPANERATLQLLRAHALRSVGRVADAAEEYSAVFRTFERLKNRDRMGDTLIGWVDALALLEHYTEAVEVARRGRSLVRDEEARARLESNLANALYNAGRFQEAGRAYRKSRNHLLDAGRDFDAAIVGYNLANVELRQGNVPRARELFTSSREIFTRKRARSLQLRTDYALASLQITAGDWQGGLDALARLEPKLEAIGDRRAVASLLREQAEALASLGAVDLAAAPAGRAHEEFRELGLRAEQARALLVYGRVLGLAGKHHDAAAHLEQAAQHWHQTGNAWSRHCAHLDLGWVCLQRGDADRALELARKSLPYLDRYDPRGAGPACRALMASAFLAKRQPAAAERHARQAHRGLQKYPFLLVRPATALTLAQALGKRRQHSLAVRWAHRAVDQMEQALRSHGPRLFEGGAYQERDRIYRGAIEVALRSGGPRGPRKALELIGRARSVDLIEGLLGDPEATRDRALRQSISRLRDDLLGEEGPGSGSTRFRRLRVEADHLQGILRRRPWGGSQLQRMLNGNDVTNWARRLNGRRLVVYDDNGSVWRAITLSSEGRVDLVSLPKARAALDGPWTSLRLIFGAAAGAPSKQRKALLAETEEEARGHFAALYEAFIAPVTQDGSPAIFVPSGALHGLPLEAVAEAAGSTAMARIPHPTLLRPPRRPNNRAALLLRDDNEGARIEATSVARLLRRGGYEVQRSRRRKALETREKPLGVLHVAAHGAFHVSDWLASGLRLGDGWLGYEQLRQGGLRDGLLYLGSCESGLVRGIPGAELDGWVAAGISAGAQELVLTSWKVDDEAAILFAQHFFEEWLHGHAALAAAARARADLRSRSPHPFQWAPFFAVSRSPFAGGALPP